MLDKAPGAASADVQLLWVVLGRCEWSGMSDGRMLLSSALEEN